MIRLLLIVFISFIGVSVPARQIRLSSDQIEAMFLKQNLALIAERMNVSIADAAIAEATVWDNPELSVGDINFWKRRGSTEARLPVPSSFRSNSLRWFRFRRAG